MKKIFAIFAVFCIMSMGACFSPWDGSDQGTIVINLENGGARTLAEGDKYTVILTNSGETAITEPITGLQYRRSLEPGLWNVLISRTNKDNKFNGYGEKDVEVVAGAVKSASITVKTTDENVTKVVNTWDELRAVFEKNTSINETVIIIRDLSTHNSMNLEGKTWNITLRADKNVTITNNSKETSLSLFRVLNNCQLTLDGSEGKITIDGNGGGYGHSLFLVQSGGQLTMKEGVTITNNKITFTNPQRSGGVTVNGGTFTMLGGNISKNSAPYGGGVRVISGTFIKTDGTIFGYTAGDSNSNRATAPGNQNGHAVYFDESNRENREDTAEPKNKFTNGSSWTL